MNAYHEQITELFDEYYRDKTAVTGASGKGYGRLRKERNK